MELYFVKTLHSCSTSGLMYMSVRGLCANHSTSFYHSSCCWHFEKSTHGEANQ